MRYSYEEGGNDGGVYGEMKHQNSDPEFDEL